MKLQTIVWPSMRLESHFGDRLVRCFAERPRSLYALLEAAARDHSEREAIVCGSERLCWRELALLVSKLAAGLAQRGVQAGDRVALLVGNRIEFVAALFAVARLGAVSVPISIREQTPGLAYMINDCGACLIVHDADLVERLPDAAAILSVRTECRLAIAMSPKSLPPCSAQPARARLRLCRKRMWP